MIPLMINEEKAREIIESRKEKRTFFFKKGVLWVGIDNREGKAWVRKYSTLNGCMKWLRREAL